MMTDQQIEDYIKTLDRPVMRLTLHAHWFNLIARGEKTEEYRECKPYWDRRFEESHVLEDFHPYGYLRVRGQKHRAIGCYVLFSNGYKKGSRKMLAVITSVQRRKAHQLGAPKEPCWVISFGAVDCLNFDVNELGLQPCRIDWKSINANPEGPDYLNIIVIKFKGKRQVMVSFDDLDRILPADWLVTDPVRYGEHWVGVRSGDWWAMIPRHWISITSQPKR
jgi:hypothetical protein